MKKQFDYKINDKQINKFLKQTLDITGDLTLLMKTARVVMKRIIDENFETQGTKTGDKWQEWSDKWKKKRLKMDKTAGILTLDGYLRRSIKAQSGRDFALVSTDKDYAAIHNFGGTKLLKHNQKMPKREFMRFDENAKDELYTELYLKFEDILDEIEERKIKSGS